MNLGGKSGVAAYECGPTWIEVEFKKGAHRYYKYTHSRPGPEDVEEMKRLAKAGDGLNSYISRHVKDNFESKR